MEWRTSNPDDPALAVPLAILAHDNNSHCVKDLASIVNSDVTSLRSILTKCSFLIVPEKDSDKISFVSNAFRSYAATQLEALKDDTWQRLADYYLTVAPETTLDRLPTYLANAGRGPELLKVLEPNTFIKLLTSTDSFLPLDERCALGLSTALSLKRYPDVIRFHVQRGMACDASEFPFDKAEVIAHLALNDYPTALSLAQSAVLRHQRLQLMAAIARTQKDQGLSPEATLLQAIESLAQQVDPREMGDQFIEVASDLIGIRPNIALSMIARLAPDSNDSRNIDTALLRLSAIVATDATSSGAGMSSTLEDIHSKISNPSARELSQTVSMVLRSNTAEEILRHVKDVTSASEKLFLLRQWCAHTETPSAAGPVIDHAVFLTLRTSEYLPTARDFRELCEPLPFIEDQDFLRSLITALDLQKESAHNAGPIQEFVKWQLLIAEAESRLNPARAGQRLTETYFEVTSLKHLEVKAVCLSLIVGSLSKIDATSAFKDTSDVREMSELELLSDVSQLLCGTASHYTLTRGIVEALAIPRPDLALTIIEQYNYESRRDEALSDLARLMLRVPANQISFQGLAALIGRWADISDEDAFIASSLRRIGKISDTPLLDAQRDHIFRLMRRGLKISRPDQLCTATSHTLALLARLESHDEEFRELVEAALKRGLEEIGEPPVKFNAGFRVVTALADHRRELAAFYLKKLDEERATYDNLSGDPFILSIQLVLRAYAGLLPKRLHRDTDIDRIAALIDRVSSDDHRLHLWASLATRMFRLERDEEGRKIVQARLRPLLDSIREAAPYEWATSVVFCASALYCYSESGAEEYIRMIPKRFHERAYIGILKYVVTGLPTWEPSGGHSVPGYHLSYDKCIEVLHLLEHVEMDNVVYRYIKHVVDSATWKHNRDYPTQEQRNELASMIRRLSSTKFPNPRFIKHDGFAILANAQAERLLRERQANWEPLVQRANAMTNVADKVYVLTFLADVMHSGLVDQRSTLFDSARQLALSIPSFEDQVERLYLLADALRDFDKAKSKLVIGEAVNIVLRISQDEPSVDELRRNLVDLAYQIDPEYATTLSSQLDQDDGRKIARARVAYQKAKESVRDTNASLEELSETELEDFQGIAWGLLGSLNADRIKPREVVNSLAILGRADGLPIHEGFPILSWFIENLVRRRGDSREATTLLRDMFEGVLSASEVGGAIMARAAGRAIGSIRPTSSRSTGGTLIEAGQREGAVKKLTTWLEDVGEQFLYICDPYFGMTELDILELVLKTKPDLKVHIITSKKRQETDRKNRALELNVAYSEYWRQNFSDQNPPDTEIVIVGDASQDLPVHDRWMLSGNGGIRLGTSFNQIGYGKDSEISTLTPVEYEERLRETESLLRREKLGRNGRRLGYETFWL